jgi:hypothetical protein
MRPITIVISAILFTACGCMPAQGLLCDLSAIYSVNVEVRSATGDELQGTTAFFRTLNPDPDGDSQSEGPFEACEQIASGFACGIESAGRIQVVIEADGHNEASHIVEVLPGECHVEPERLDVVLEPTACTTEEVPSVLLSLIDHEGQRIPGAFADWGRPDADSLGQPCEELGSDLACGWEQSGTLEILAGASGYQPWLQNIEVEAGVCHVQTRYIEVVLEESDQPCTDEVRPSIIVVVTDHWDNPLPFAETHFVAHMKPLEPESCFSSNNGRFFCGEEEPGEFDVRVRAEGYLPWSTTIRVESNQCHVETQHLTAVLEDMVIDG